MFDHWTRFDLIISIFMELNKNPVAVYISLYQRTQCKKATYNVITVNYCINTEH